VTSLNNLSSFESVVNELRQLVDSALPLVDPIRVNELGKKLDAYKDAVASLTRAGADVPDVLRDASATLQAEVDQAVKAEEILLGVRAGLEEMLADIAKSLKSNRPRGRSRLASGDQPRRPRSRTEAPRAFILCGTSYVVTTWIDVLRRLLRLLSERHESNFGAILSVRNTHKILFSTEPNDLRRAELIPTTKIYMELSQRSSDISELCIRCVRLFGYAETDFEILLSD
jgi:hypothetical protein